MRDDAGVAQLSRDRGERRARADLEFEWVGRKRKRLAIPRECERGRGADREGDDNDKSAKQSH